MLDEHEGPLDWRKRLSYKKPKSFSLPAAFLLGKAKAAPKVTGLDWTADGKSIVAVSDDGQVKLFAVQEEKLLPTQRHDTHKNLSREVIFLLLFLKAVIQGFFSEKQDQCSLLL